jgi:hypothetical protein
MGALTQAVLTKKKEREQRIRESISKDRAYMLNNRNQEER